MKHKDSYGPIVFTLVLIALCSPLLFHEVTGGALFLFALGALGVIGWLIQRFTRFTAPELWRDYLLAVPLTYVLGFLSWPFRASNSSIEMIMLFWLIILAGIFVLRKYLSAKAGFAVVITVFFITLRLLDLFGGMSAVHLPSFAVGGARMLGPMAALLVVFLLCRWLEERFERSLLLPLTIALAFHLFSMPTDIQGTATDFGFPFIGLTVVIPSALLFPLIIRFLPPKMSTQVYFMVWSVLIVGSILVWPMRLYASVWYTDWTSALLVSLSVALPYLLIIWLALQPARQSEGEHARPDSGYPGGSAQPFGVVK
ncbi:hypothetical protein HC928_03440 [bacterium]|nr:hypothetical protein [bacterium]